MANVLENGRMTSSLLSEQTWCDKVSQSSCAPNHRVTGVKETGQRIGGKSQRGDDGGGNYTATGRGCVSDVCRENDCNGTESSSKVPLPDDFLERAVLLHSSLFASREPVSRSDGTRISAEARRRELAAASKRPHHFARQNPLKRRRGTSDVPRGDKKSFLSMSEVSSEAFETRQLDLGNFSGDDQLLALKARADLLRRQSSDLVAPSSVAVAHHPKPKAFLIFSKCVQQAYEAGKLTEKSYALLKRLLIPDELTGERERYDDSGAEYLRQLVIQPAPTPILRKNGVMAAVENALLSNCQKAKSINYTMHALGAIGKFPAPPPEIVPLNIQDQSRILPEHKPWTEFIENGADDEKCRTQEISLSPEQLHYQIDHMDPIPCERVACFDEDIANGVACKFDPTVHVTKFAQKRDVSYATRLSLMDSRHPLLGGCSESMTEARRRFVDQQVDSYNTRSRRSPFELTSAAGMEPAPPVVTRRELPPVLIQEDLSDNNNHLPWQSVVNDLNEPGVIEELLLKHERALGTPLHLLTAVVQKKTIAVRLLMEMDFRRSSWREEYRNRYADHAFCESSSESGSEEEGEEWDEREGCQLSHAEARFFRHEEKQDLPELHPNLSKTRRKEASDLYRRLIRALDLKASPKERFLGADGRPQKIGNVQSSSYVRRRHESLRKENEQISLSRKLFAEGTDLFHPLSSTTLIDMDPFR